MLSIYKGNSVATSPASSTTPYLVTLSNPPVDEPVAVAFANSPYTIANVTAIQERTFLVSTAGGAVTINLPGTPVDGEIINIKRTTSDGNTLTIARNGKNIEGAASNFTDANPGLSSYQFQYATATGWWLIGG